MVAAVIVMYFPSNDQEKLWKEVSSQFDKTYIIYNSLLESEIFESNAENNYEIIQMPRNMGIAYVLNYAKRRATIEGFEWLFTFDQDSHIDLSYSSQLLCINSISDSVAMVCPLVVDENMGRTKDTKSDIEYVDMAITSGCCIRLSKSKDLEFDSSLFIDYVDYDFCLKIKNSGMNVLRKNSVILLHSIGSHTNKVGVYTSNHNDRRRYYMFRNRTYLIKKYFWSNTIWSLREMIRYPTETIKIVFFENKKFVKLLMCLQGVVDGFIGKMGEKSV